jgi:5-methylthioadenosine/S-adenosylhomocysteine deaminase
MVKSIALLTISVLFAPALCLAQRKGPFIDLIVSNGTVVTMDSGRRVIQKGAVVVDRGKIVAVGGPELTTRYRARQTIDANGGVIIPGLINGHTHVPMVLFRGLADDLDLNEWLTKYIFPAEARNVTEDFVRAGTQLGLAEMIRGGTTTYCDMYYFEDAVADETAKAGVRGVLGETIIDFPVADNKTNAEAMAYTERFIKHWTGHALITAAIAPHAPYTVSAEHLIAARALSDRTGAPLVTHIAETRKELDDITRDKGQPPISYLEKIGFFNDRVIAAHVVFPAQGEISILKKHNVGVVHNPQSNMKLASGVAPVPAMLAADLSVGLGTDGAASNNDLDMFEEVDTAAKLHKLFSSDPKVLSAEQAFEMATIRGARALHMEKKIGSLEVGKRADIVIIDSDAINEVPSYNVYSQLVYSAKAADVRSVVVEGRVLMLNRRLLTLDEPSIRMRAKAYRDKIRRSLEQKSAWVAPTGTTVMAGISSYSH